MNRDELQKIVYTTGQVVQMFEAALGILEAAQASISAPALEEVAEILEGKRPLTPQAWLLAVFQRAIVDAENLASDLRAVDLETLRNVHEIRLSGVEISAIEEAIHERGKAEPLEEAEPGASGQLPG